MATPDQIADLIFKYLEKRLTPEEEKVLLQWMDESEINKRIFDKFVSGELEPLTEEGQIEKKQEWEKLERKYFKASPTPKNHAIYFVALAFFVLICIAVYIRINSGPPDKSRNSISRLINNDPAMYGVILTLADGRHVNIDTAKEQIRQCNAVISKHGNQISYESVISNTYKEEFNSIQTNNGRTFQITLPDGSKVWLNAVSNIRYPTAFGGTERKVRISGEAYFEITKAFDSLHNKIPFKVESNGVAITVLGTHFNINSYPNELVVKTTLLEGSIELRHGKSTYLLSPGQQAQINSTGKINIKNIEIDEITAWKNDLFIFNDLPIEPAMREIARWYGVDVVYEDFITKRLTTTIPRHMTLPDVLDILETTTGLTFKLQGNQIIIQK